MRDVWQDFWEGQRSAHHTSESADYYRRHATELHSLFPHPSPQRVLDLGCGNGVLYELLGFDKTQQYRGVDFSQSMLDEFKASHPGVDVELGDAAAYRDDSRYDLVFSNGLVQYFDTAMLGAHLANVRSMLDVRSAYVCGSIPWRSRRGDFVSGRIFPPYRSSLRRVARDKLRGTLHRRDGIGTWFEPGELAAAAERLGMKASFFGAFQLYRFHAVFTPSGT